MGHVNSRDHASVPCESNLSRLDCTSVV